MMNYFDLKIFAILRGKKEYYEAAKAYAQDNSDLSLSQLLDVFEKLTSLEKDQKYYREQLSFTVH